MHVCTCVLTQASGMSSKLSIQSAIPKWRATAQVDAAFTEMPLFPRPADWEAFEQDGSPYDGSEVLGSFAPASPPHSFVPCSRFSDEEPRGSWVSENAKGNEGTPYDDDDNQFPVPAKPPPGTPERRGTRRGPEEHIATPEHLRPQARRD